MRWFFIVLFLSLLVSCGTSIEKGPIEQEIEVSLPNSSDSLYADDKKFVLEVQGQKSND